jgi:Putative Flp pilus-assembly TadE/G-like
MNGQRGQTLPIWVFGLLTSLMLMVMVFDYANDVRWQIRAQNAADAVAESIISVQAQHYNKMLMNLHAAAVEEWRIRKTMTALLTVLQGNGGCGTSAHGGLSCDYVYNSLRANYIADVNRYTQDVQTMAALAQYSYTQQQADMTQIAQGYNSSNCGSNGSSTQADCADAGSALQRTRLAVGRHQHLVRRRGRRRLVAAQRIRVCDQRPLAAGDRSRYLRHRAAADRRVLQAHRRAVPRHWACRRHQRDGRTRVDQSRQTDVSELGGGFPAQRVPGRRRRLDAGRHGRNCERK